MDIIQNLKINHVNHVTLLVLNAIVVKITAVKAVTILILVFLYLMNNVYLHVQKDIILPMENVQYATKTVALVLVDKKLNVLHVVV